MTHHANTAAVDGGEPLRILAVPGSLRRASYNKMLLDGAAELAPSGMTVDVFDGLGTVPMFNEDLESHTPAGVALLRDFMARSDGLLIASPEYNQSVPGVVKNMIDWLSRVEGKDGLTGKPVAVIGATTGPWGTRISQTLLRQMLLSTQALVLPQPALFIPNAGDVFDADHRLADPATRTRLHEVLVAFARWIRQLSPPLEAAR